MNRARLVRENKPFAVWDLLVYAVIAALLVVLFLVFVVFDVFGTDSARGIRVQVNDEIVYTYVFGDGGTVAQGWEDRVEERTDGSLLLVRITTDDGWNEIAIDEEGQTAVMRDADCSLRKDCTAMRAIGDGGSVITCIPHGLKVLPLAGEDISAPSVG